MKFKFIGNNSESNGFCQNEIYQILQFGIKNNYFIIYVINNRKEMNVIPYSSVNKFNENWIFIENN